ncbi:MAG TPA: phosphate acyltransferase PlsX [Verrucomicrobiae bacterium]
MRIAVDVMGGDHGCGVIIAGVKGALAENKDITTIYLVGNKADIHAALPPRGFRDHRVRIIHASEVVEMEDKPAIALRKKKDSSIARAAELVRDGEADALISLGNTGGIFAAGTFKVGRIPGVDRGCIATVIPRLDGEFVLLDSGANVECKPLHLAQFAVMGSVYSREILKRKNPRVGILSIGSEDNKGNELTLETFKLCKKLNLNFIGNVEGHDLFKDHVDVVVCDGFVGNIVLKTIESLAVAMFSMLKRELMHSPQRKLGAYLAKGAFQSIRRRMDPELYGGAPMLGFNGLVFKAHASARERAVTSAIRVTANAVKTHINQTIARDIAAANLILEAETGTAKP